jgi:hypothetical protein
VFFVARRAAAIVGVSLLLAGCGSDRFFSAPTTVTLPAKGAHSGGTMTCKHGDAAARATVPELGRGIDVAGDGATSSAEIRIIHRIDGAVVVTCSG